MRVLTLLMIAAALVGCGGKNYKAQIDFLSLQLEANRAAESARADRLQERETMCAGLTEPGAISACMLGITATTLAERSGGNAQPQIVMPPQAPRTGLEVVGDIAVGALKVAVPGFVTLRQSEHQRDVSIANSNALYGFLGDSAQAWAGFGTSAIEGMGVVGIEALQQMRGATSDVAAVLPQLAPRIEIRGTGNVVGNQNQVATDLSRTGGDRFQTGAAATIAIDRSVAGRDRLQQSGTGNRQASPDTTVGTRCTAPGGTAVATAAELARPPSADGGTITCVSEVP